MTELHRTTARIVIVDDEPVVRDGLRLHLDHDESLDVVAQLSDGSEVVEYLRNHAVDLVLLDVQMPVMDGPTALRHIVSEHPGTRVLLMTTPGNEVAPSGERERCCNGCLSKGASPEEILAAVHRVLEERGAEALDGGADLVQPVRASGRKTREFGLTEREADVLELLCQAFSNRDIANRLSLAESTVKAYVAAMMTKMECVSRVHIVVTAYKNNLLVRE